MALLLQAEVLKLFRRKAYPLMVLILAGLVGMTAFFLVIFPRVAPGLAEGLEPIPKPEGYILGAQQVIGQTWFPLILAVMMLGTEMSGTFWATSLSRESRRLRHVLARLVVLSVASWLAVAAAIAGFSLVVAVGGVGEGAPSLGQWARIFGSALMVQVAWVAMGLGLVGLLRSVGPAIGAALAFSFGESLLGLWRPYANVSLTANSTALLGTLQEGPLTAFIPGAGIPPGRAAVVVLIWSMFAVALAWWSLAYRDP
ncbi:MAG TPA: hypothetical protein VHL52_06090 [Acidimicrobiia bacterium]|nr:hypothetical protein [Acidimicrobiia bacterium]